MWTREMNLETEFPLRLLGTQMLVVSCPCQPMTWLGFLFWPMTQLCLCDTILMMLDKDWWLPELCRYLDSTLVCISVTLWHPVSGDIPLGDITHVTCVGLIWVMCDQLTPGEEEGLIHADIGDNDSTRMVLIISLLHLLSPRLWPGRSRMQMRAGHPRQDLIKIFVLLIFYKSFWHTWTCLSWSNQNSEQWNMNITYKCITQTWTSNPENANCFTYMDRTWNTNWTLKVLL